MRLGICLLLVALCLVFAEAKILPMRIGIPPAEAPNARARAPVWGQIVQRLDHFNENDNRLWYMRYLSNDQFFQSGGPMFIFLGGEWEIDSGWLMSGQMFDMARNHGGHMFYTEHRFYGKSYPLGDFTSNSLYYMASYQALADLAYFIVDRKAKVPGLANSKVVVVGASYSASLATWARLTYPDLIDAAYASSAPLLAVEDFYQYEEVVGASIYRANEQCWRTIQEGMREMENLMDTPEGRDKLTRDLHTCTRITGEEPDRSQYFNSVGSIWSGTVQYAQANTIQSECSSLLSHSGDSFDKLAAYVASKYGGGCIGNYENFVSYYRDNTQLSTDSGRTWMYQTCTEFGFFQTTNSDNHPFGKNVLVDFFRSWCADIYGPEYDASRIQQGIAYSNSIYGALRPNTTRVVSVHGNVDPWHAIGLTSSLKDMPAYLVEGTSHCADLNSISSSDSQQMRQVKQQVQQYIASWIS